MLASRLIRLQGEREDESVAAVEASSHFLVLNYLLITQINHFITASVDLVSDCGIQRAFWFQMVGIPRQTVNTESQMPTNTHFLKGTTHLVFLS